MATVAPKCALLQKIGLQVKTLCQVGSHRWRYEVPKALDAVFHSIVVHRGLSPMDQKKWHRGPVWFRQPTHRALSGSLCRCSLLRV